MISMKKWQIIAKMKGAPLTGIGLKFLASLCEESITEKWNENSTDDILDECPFCLDAEHQREKLGVLRDTDGEPIVLSRCDLCICPVDICDESAREGFIYTIQQIVKENGDIKTVKDLHEHYPHLLKTMIEIFEYHRKKAEMEILELEAFEENRQRDKCE
jgi:hypothetical protein